MPTSDDDDLRATIALLRGSIISPDAKYRVSVNCADLTAILDAAERAQSARIEALEAERKWRPTKTKPEPGMPYIGAWGGHVTQCWETRNKPRLWMLPDGSTTATPPDAWLPLPPPPAQGDGT